MNKKKICFIAQFPPPMHGLSKAVDTLYRSELAEEFEFEKVDITNNKNFLKNLQLIMRSHADLFYFTISQTKGGNLRDLVILKLLEMQRKKCLIHLHGGYYRKLVDNNMANWQKAANYRAIKKLAGVIVLGKSLKSIFMGMITEDKIYIVPNCVDDEYLMSDEKFRHKVETIDQRPVKHMLYLSNFIRTKGYPEVLQLAKMEKERCEKGGKKELHFDFAGKFFDITEEKFFFSYISNNNLNDYVTYHGIVGGDKKRELLKMGDYFALLTRYANEGQPISILEAMGNGMVILTTNHAGIPDVVVDGENGIVLHEDESIDTVFKRLRDVDMRHTIICNRNKVYSQYREKMYVENMEKCWKLEQVKSFL